jgi:type IV fimbrial biogenesis protein FimT
MQKQSAKNSGFTLIELVVTVSLAGILMAVAIPSFIEAIKSNRLTTQANEFMAALNLARSEAIKRGVQVTVQRKGSTSGAWEDGWDVFVDSDANETFSDDFDANPCETNADGSPSEDCLLKTYPALAGSTLRTGNSTYKNYAAYAASGLSINSSQVDTFTLCQGTDTSLSREIKISSTGRARVSVGTAPSCP